MPHKQLNSRSENIGDFLKNQREILGMSIEDVSSSLKVKVKDIALIEQNSTDLITKHLYLLGFIKSYCRLLKVKDDVIEDYLKNMNKSCNSKNKSHQLINFDAELNLKPSKDYLVNALILLILINLLLISFSQFKSQNLAITNIIIKQLDKVD